MRNLIGKYGYIHSYRHISPFWAAHMRQWTGSAWVQVMAFRLFGSYPLLEQM